MNPHILSFNNYSPWPTLFHNMALPVISSHISPDILLHLNIFQCVLLNDKDLLKNIITNTIITTKT